MDAALLLQVDELLELRVVLLILPRLEDDFSAKVKITGQVMSSILIKRTGEPSALITFPKVARDLLISEPSLRRRRLTRSWLARSLKKT